ncbi:MAG TPA: transcriptional activator domain-containing protein [Micromonosporaceae bacterium]|nr:transcriptional activator domain-containing protein [Micromonosporaceae bacterium]HCU50120.1 transcriptional activator domain-containing protein [Micromonosporaceae bacterium]
MIRLLGRFEVHVNGVPVAADSWRSRRAADLVKILALDPSQSVHREQVMDLLWPELSEEAAAANLRKAVHYARRALGAEEAIRSESGLLTLWDGGADVDATHFLAAADAALAANDQRQCAEAVALYGGELLPNDRYEPWAEEARQRIRSRWLALLKAAHMWQQALDVDPTDEQSHRELMLAHLNAGQRRDAIRQFERLREVLREHIGVAPDKETIALYQQVLAMDGDEPVLPEQRAAVLIATGLVHLNRQEFDQAERLARQALEIATDHELPHEVGDASTLLGLVASQTGRWYDTFRAAFVSSLHQNPQLAMATYDANLCMAEYHITGAVPGTDPVTYASELLSLAESANSLVGQGIAQFMIGESHLLAGRYPEAHTWLERALRTNRGTGIASGLCLTLERLAQTELALSQVDKASQLLDQARHIADTSPMRSHLLVRLLGVHLEATAQTPHSQFEVQRSEQTLTDMRKTCEPCSINFHVRAATITAHTGDLPRSRRHVNHAERIAGLWQGGPCTAAVWEARAALRAAEGHNDQAAALLREAAHEYGRAGRFPDEQRCRDRLQPMHATPVAP